MNMECIGFRRATRALKSASRTEADGPTGESGTSIRVLDIGTDIMNFMVPVRF